MFDQLKKKSATSALLRMGVLVAITAIILFVSKDSLLKLYEGPKNLESLGIDEISGAYVDTDVYAILSNFAEYYETDKYGNETVTDQYYIIPVGEEEFIALQIDSSDYELADQIYNETYDVLNGTKGDFSTTMPVTGTINKMDDEVYDYYKEWFETSGYLENPTQEEIESIALPYTLQVDYVGGFEDYVLYGAIFVMGLFLLWVVVIIIKLLFGLYLSDIKRFIRKNESYINEERLEVDYASSVEIGKVHVGKMCFYYFKGSQAKILANKEIVWAYLESVTHRTYGIKTNVSKFLIIYTKDKKMYKIPMKKVDYVNEVLKQFSINQPHIVIGYSEELKKCFRKDFNTFINLNAQSQENPETLF